jgi:transcriptional regulator with XRE-family HTH domain
MQISERIKKIRKKTELSQAVFSESLGVTRSHISKIEGGIVSPSNQLIKSICRVYGVREEWLRDGKGRITEKTLKQKNIQDYNLAKKTLSYESGINNFIFVISWITTLSILTKPFVNLEVKLDDPDAIEFLRLKKELEKSIKKLLDMFSGEKK